MATRKAVIKVEKVSELELLKIIARTTDDGWQFPAASAKELTNFKTCARIFDSGLVDMNKNAFGYWYTISEKGRKAIVVDDASPIVQFLRSMQWTR